MWKVIEHKPYSHKADVFGFGITMWELHTGKVKWSSLISFPSKEKTQNRYLFTFKASLTPVVHCSFLPKQLPYEHLSPLQAAVGVVQKVRTLFFDNIFPYSTSLFFSPCTRGEGGVAQTCECSSLCFN